MRDGETFEHCQLRMREMLLAQGHTGDVVWIFREDCIWYKKVLLIGPIDRAANHVVANGVFDDDARYPYGVEMSLVAIAVGTLYCALLAPRSMSDAEYEFIHGIKLSVPLRLPVCRSIANSSEWSKMLAVRHSGEWDEDLLAKTMRKSDVLDAYGPLA